MSVRRKCFISYHHADQAEVEKFLRTFDDVRDTFIKRALGVNYDLIDSDDSGYIMRRIREMCLADSSVTIVMVGKCTWARKYVDWEIASTLRNDPVNKRSGLMGIVLPSAGQSPIAPSRLSDNLGSNGQESYAKWYWYPQYKAELQEWIEDAYQARSSRAHLVRNGAALFGYNRSCQ